MGQNLELSSQHVLGTAPATGVAEPVIWAKNTSSSTVTPSYELVLNTLNPGWFAFTCDNLICYSFIVGNATMGDIPAGDSVLIFKLTVDPQGVMDTGRVVYSLWDNTNPADTQWVTFQFDFLTSIDDPLAAFSMAPQPANNYVRLDLPPQPMYIELWNLQGQKMREVAAEGPLRLDTAGLLAGTYWLRLSDESGYVGNRRLVIQH